MVERYAGAAPDRVRLIRVRLPLLRPFATARGTVNDRTVILVSVENAGVTGWGECAPFPGHTPEDPESVWTALSTRIPLLMEGADLGATTAPMPPTARAGVEAAVADLSARLEARPLWRVLGGTRKRVTVSAAVGLSADPAEVLADIEDAVAAGYRHVKLKIAPGRDVAVVQAVRERFPGLGIGVDANGSYATASDPAFDALDALALSFLEQPLPPTDLDGHSLLRRLRTPVCVDEAAGDEAAALAVIGARAADVVNLKPGRLGPGASVRVHDAATSAGIRLRVGGLLESGIGRGHALAVATLPGCDLPADITGSGRYFADDLVDHPWTVDGGTITAPDAPGIGVSPDPAALDRHAVERLHYD